MSGGDDFFRPAGCPAPTYRVEATIIKATGNAEEGCLEAIGVDQCANVSSFAARSIFVFPSSRSAALVFFLTPSRDFRVSVLLAKFIAKGPVKPMKSKSVCFFFFRSELFKRRES